MHARARGEQRVVAFGAVGHPHPGELAARPLQRQHELDGAIDHRPHRFEEPDVVAQQVVVPCTDRQVRRVVRIELRIFDGAVAVVERGTRRRGAAYAAATPMPARQTGAGHPGRAPSQPRRGPTGRRDVLRTTGCIRRAVAPRRCGRAWPRCRADAARRARRDRRRWGGASCGHDLAGVHHEALADQRIEHRVSHPSGQRSLHQVPYEQPMVGAHERVIVRRAGRPDRAAQPPVGRVQAVGVVPSWSPRAPRPGAFR